MARKPQPDAARTLAFEVLSAVNRKDAYSNLLLPKKLNESSLNERDRGFVTELVYGTLRMQGRHDYFLSKISDRDWNTVDDSIVDLARMGVHQLHQMRIPDHAAVSATVELARKIVGESKAAYVNALLRKISKHNFEFWMESLSDLIDPVSYLSARYSHPEWIVSSYLDVLKDLGEVEKLLIANNVPAIPTLVSWPGKSVQTDLFTYGATATKYSPFGATLKRNPGDLPLIRSRMAGVQDEGSQLVAHYFAKAAADKNNWLDICAGPGGKAALLSHIAQTSGKDFFANEISEPRSKLVSQVVTSGVVWTGDARSISDRGMKFGAILADVPCTGLGALRRRPEVRWRRSTTDLPSLTKLQSEIIQASLEVLEDDGIFGYATCSPHIAETRMQVSELVKRFPNLKQIDLAELAPLELVHQKCLSLWTHLHDSDCMFLALFRKVS